MDSNTVFNKDFNAKSIYVMKIFSAEVSEVWNYFTKSELLDEWWAPKPWKCETLQMDFAENGTWLYAMKSPEGQKMYSLAKYGEITEHRSFDSTDGFCDENGMIDPTMPQTKWLIGFTGVEEGTKVTFNLHFQTEEDLNKTLEMGFEQGFKTGLQQLEEILNNK